jgi:hypothetical protein
MTYDWMTTDASDQYRPSSSAATPETEGTPLQGNLSHLMKHDFVLMSQRLYVQVPIAGAVIVGPESRRVDEA